MNNLSATKSICNAICNTFYPDDSAVEVCLFNADIDPVAEAMPKDVAIFRVALRLIKGYVEGNRSENGISASVRSEEAIRNSIRSWCADYGIDADEFLQDTMTIIDNASDLW